MNISETKAGLVKTVRQLVGSSLATIKTANGEIGAVYQARQKSGTRANFPYIVVDYLGSIRQGYSYRRSYWDDNDDRVHEFDVTLRFIIDIHSNEDVGSEDIALDLRHKLFTSKGRELLREETNGSILDLSDPSFNSVLMNTDYEEVSRLTLDLSTRFIRVDNTLGTIDSVSVEGELYKHFVQEEPPIDINITAP